MPCDTKPSLWVHGAPAQSLNQVASYLLGDAHDRSKVQVLVDGRFYSLADMIGDDND